MQLFKRFVHPSSKLSVKLVDYVSRSPGDISYTMVEVPTLSPFPQVAKLGMEVQNQIAGTTLTWALTVEEAPPGSSFAYFVNEADLLNTAVGGGARFITPLVDYDDTGIYSYVIKVTVTDSLGRVATDTMNIDIDFTEGADPLDTTFQILINQSPVNSGQGTISVINVPPGVGVLNLKTTLEQNIPALGIGGGGQAIAQIDYNTSYVNLSLNPTTLSANITTGVNIIASQIIGNYNIYRTDSFSNVLTLRVQVMGPAVPGAPRNITEAIRTVGAAFGNSDDSGFYNMAISGLINGVNEVFTVTFPYVTGSTRIYLNSVRQRLGIDYFETDVSEITFVNPPTSGSTLVIDYTIV